MFKNTNNSSAHFGYQEILSSDKGSLVKNVFNNVAPKYDLMNDLMSFGIHRSWKNKMLDLLNPNNKMSLVDIGGGTGDIAFRFLNRGGKHVKVIDTSIEMLLQGQARGIKNKGQTKIGWINGDAEQLPIKSESADAYTSAFCIRNVTNINIALNEACRVLKPGGHFLCLEFSSVVLPILEPAYDIYSFSVLPCLGELIAKDRNSYQYLVESIRKFPNQNRFAEMIKSAGLNQVTYKNLSGGIAAIHSAWRI